MERTLRSLLILSLGSGLFVATLSADDDAQSKSFPLPDMAEEVPQLVTFVEQIGRGDLEAAYQAIEGQLSSHLQQASGPFESGSLENWKLQFGRIEKLKSEFESVEFIGYCPVSTASRVLILVANGKSGPILFRFQMFRYRGEWKVNGVGYDTDWKLIEEGFNCRRFEQPVIYEFAPVKQAGTQDEFKS